MAQQAIKEILFFMQRAENLKNTLRCAYTSNGRQESSADHSWRLGLLAMVCAPLLDASIDVEKMLKLSIIHDLGEAISGDIPAIYQTEDDQKALRERQAMQEIVTGLSECTKCEFLQLWDEYEQGSTFEARIIKGLDKLETLMQHNQGENPDDFDYSFNVTYGQKYTSCHPLLRLLREEVDTHTSAHCMGKTNTDE